jgi:hypothetical protein
MANKKDLYTPAIIKRAIGKRCALCDKYISESEANEEDLHYSQTKSKHEIFIHKHCWNSNYGS